MANKKFFLFRITTFVALATTLCAFVLLAYLIFKEQSLKVSGRNDILIVSALFLLLFASINFQVQNIRLLMYLEKDELPSSSFTIYHTILMVFNCIGTIGLAVILYFMLYDLFRIRDNKPFAAYITIVFCSVWFLSNLITIFRSIRARIYLRIRQLHMEQQLLEDLGKHF